MARNQAKRIIWQRGFPVAYQITTGSVVNPATGYVSGGVTTNLSSYGVMNNGKLRSWGIDFVQGLIQSGALVIMVPALDFYSDPIPGGKCTFNGFLWKVQLVRTEFAGDVPCTHDLLVTR